jgi:hypothetical protein
MEKSQLIALSNSLTDLKAHICNLQILLSCESGTKESTQYLETLNERLETAVIPARNLLESTRQGFESDKVKAPVLPHIGIAGEIRIIFDSWLHIRLNTLLPHCRYQTPVYLTDTITRLLDSYVVQYGKLPLYQKVMLIIDEHCNINNRKVFDQDNKGFKAVPNALKGRVFPDDDQFTVSLSLISTENETPSCNIYVIDATDSGLFFMMWKNGLLKEL